jgi:hypothetical protein
MKKTVAVLLTLSVVQLVLTSVLVVSLINERPDDRPRLGVPRSALHQKAYERIKAEQRALQKEVAEREIEIDV